MSWAVELKSLDFICMWYSLVGGGMECRLGKKKDLLIQQGFSWYALQKLYGIYKKIKPYRSLEIHHLIIWI